ncbi:MAG: phosphotransferase, partial [Rhodospirillaceae bacterium]|nr:phosphotransferase [Rhodospirillaceae bacterium]
DPDFIKSEVEARYAFSGSVRVQLLYRGINDVYVVRDDAAKRALRVWRAGTRSLPAILQELDFLAFLKGKGVSVSSAIPARSDDVHFSLEAPEGPRTAVLYTWASGQKFGDQLDVELGGKIGAAFARLHLAARDYKPAAPVAAATAQGLIDNLPFLLDWVEDRPEDIRDYTALSERLAQVISTQQGLDLPKGMCHQDMHPSNVHVDKAGQITFIDFDGCAEGHWLHDVKNFIFGNAFYGFDAKYGAAFEQGYNGVRPYTAAERENGELFLLIKAVRLLGGAARAAKSRGRDLLRFRSLDWFAHYIKTRARALGYL